MFFKKKNKEEVKRYPFEVTLQNFDELVLDQNLPVVLDFWAAWCPTCKIMDPVMESLANEYDQKAIIGKVNVDQQRELGAKFEIKSIPTVLIIQEGMIVEHFAGIAPEPVIKRILDHL